VILAICARLPAPEALMVITTAFSGLRWGEVAGMRRKYHYLAPADGDTPASGWYEIDEFDGALKECGGRLAFGPPKDREARLVELPAFLVILLLAYLETIPARRQLLFPCGSGEGYRRGNCCRVRRPGPGPDPLAPSSKRAPRERAELRHPTPPARDRTTPPCQECRTSQADQTLIGSAPNSIVYPIFYGWIGRGLSSVLSSTGRDAYSAVASS